MRHKVAIDRDETFTDLLARSHGKPCTYPTASWAVNDLEGPAATRILARIGGDGRSSLLPTAHPKRRREPDGERAH